MAKTFTHLLSQCPGFAPAGRARRRAAAALFLVAIAGVHALPAAIAFETSLPAATPETTLFPILEKNRWGFIDGSGRVAIAARYRSTVDAESERGSGPAGGHRTPADLFMAPAIRPHGTPVVAVSVDDEWGFVNRRGELLPLRFEQVGAFTEGLAPVRIGTRWGFADSAGLVAVPLRFDGVGPFLGGVAVVHQASRYGLIDAVGRWVVQPRFESIRAADSVFHDNRALFTLFGKKGFVSRAGTIAVPPAYDDALPFAEGLAAVTRGLRSGYIDTSGRVVIPYREWTVSRFARGRAVVQVNSRYGYIDRSGDYVAAPQFHQARGFSSDDQAVAWMGARRGIVALDGHWSVPRFEEIQPFDDSLSVGKVGGRAGLIRRATAEMVREFQWEILGSFSEGLARARGSGDRMGFIDVEGHMVIPARFQQAGRFDHGLCKVATRDSLGYIDRSGAWVWATRFR